MTTLLPDWDTTRIGYGLTLPQLQDVELLVAQVHAFHRSHEFTPSDSGAESEMEDQAEVVERLCKEVRKQGS